MKYAFFNDGFVEMNKLQIHASDLSIHRSYAVFEFFKLVNGENPWIKWYLDRFQNSMRLAFLNSPFQSSEILELVKAMLEKNGNLNSCIKLLTTGGYSEDGFSPPARSNFIMMNYPFRPPSRQAYSDGVKLISSQYQRTAPQIKSTNYFQAVLNAQKMKATGAIDVLYFHPDRIFETSRCNVFIVKDKTVFTPSTGVLAGITRHRILNLEEKPCKIITRDITKNELDQADEVFISSTTKGILPVVHVDDKVIGNGKVGNMTKQLADCIRSF